jgi:hypothetical protein
MVSRLFGTRVAMVALSAATLCTPVLAQTGKGQLYAFHTRPVVGGCPGLDWHVTLGPDGTLVGFVAWDNMQHMARLEGKIQRNRAFTMQAQEVGGSRTATVKGVAAGQYINMQVDGSGTPCDGVSLQIPRVTGGMGGGGG